MLAHLYALTIIGNHLQMVDGGDGHRSHGDGHDQDFDRGHRKSTPPWLAGN